MSQVSTITRGCEQTATYIEGVFVDKQKKSRKFIYFGTFKGHICFLFLKNKVLKEVKFNSNVLPYKLVPNF